MTDTDLANVRNLSRLWRLSGADRVPLPDGSRGWRSRTWPPRAWIDPDAPITAGAVTHLASDLGDRSFPVWPHQSRVASAALETLLGPPGSRLTGMNRAADTPLPEPLSPRAHLRFVRVTEDRAADDWTRVASAGFGYWIDRDVPRALARRDDTTLVLALRDGEPAGTGLVLDADGALGVHMMGVPPGHRRRGIARAVLVHLLRTTARPGVPFTLQASAAGRPLYASLGFEDAFPFPMYRAPQPAPSPRNDTA